MYRRFHGRFGSAGVIVAVIALVAALGGTALAASGALTGKQKKEVEKIAKKFAGKSGAPGVAGTNGTNGTNGKDGAPGEKGVKGDPGIPGTPGTPGTDGHSPEELATLAPGEEGCASGGVLYGIPGGEEFPICNGEKGDTGAPWPAGGTLPPGATETGAWAFAGSPSDEAGIYVPISFAIPLSAPISSANVHFITEPGFAAKCLGNVGAVMDPEPGNLCVYGQEAIEGSVYGGIFQNVEEELKGANRAGAILKFSAPTEATRGGGTFAVEAPAGP